MNKLFYIILLALLPSCKSSYTITVASGTDASEPEKGNFIKLKTGKELKLSDNLEMNSDFVDVDNTRIIKVGDKKYKGKDIASFQVNGDYYSNTAKNTFARRIYRGPINVFENTKTSTTTSQSAGGGMHTTNSSRTYYHVQNPKIEKGNLTQINLFGANKKLDAYLKGYKPSLDIMAKYQQQRHVSRIVKFSTLGVWLASVPLLIAAKNNSSLQSIAGVNLFLGVIYVPVFSLAFKARNHARPYEAVQKYIDNNFIQEPVAVAITEPPVLMDSLKQNPTQTAQNPSKNTTNDFLEFSDGKLIEALPGTKLKSANNKIFSINNQKYTSGIVAYQINKKYFKQFPGTKDETAFAQRTISGKIEMYNFVGTRSQNSSNGTSSNFSNYKNEFFVKDNTEGYIRKRWKLGPYLQDNPIAFSKFNDMMRTRKKVIIASWAMSLASCAAITGVFVSKGNTGPYVFAGLATGISLINYSFAKKQSKKINRQFVDVINTYNGTKKSRGIASKH